MWSVQIQHTDTILDGVLWSCFCVRRQQNNVHYKEIIVLPDDCLEDILLVVEAGLVMVVVLISARKQNCF